MNNNAFGTSGRNKRKYAALAVILVLIILLGVWVCPSDRKDNGIVVSTSDDKTIRTWDIELE